MKNLSGLIALVGSCLWISACGSNTGSASSSAALSNGTTSTTLNGTGSVALLGTYTLSAINCESYSFSGSTSTFNQTYYASLALGSNVDAETLTFNSDGTFIQLDSEGSCVASTTGNWSTSLNNSTTEVSMYWLSLSNQSLKLNSGTASCAFKLVWTNAYSSANYTLASTTLSLNPGNVSPVTEGINYDSSNNTLSIQSTSIHSTYSGSASEACMLIYAQ